MFRDVFARIYIPFGYGQMAVNPFQFTDLSEAQLHWLASRAQDLAVFHDQSIDIFDFAGALGGLGNYKVPPKEAHEIFQLASFQLQAAAAALSVAFDFRGAIQSCLIGAELSLKAGLAAQGADEKERRKHGHDSASAANVFSKGSQAFDLDRVVNAIKRLPQYVENRYSPEQPDRMAVGHIVMGAQYVAGEVARQIGEYSIRSAMTHRCSESTLDLTERPTTPASWRYATTQRAIPRAHFDEPRLAHLPSIRKTPMRLERKCPHRVRWVRIVALTKSFKDRSKFVNR